MLEGEPVSESFTIANRGMGVLNINGIDLDIWNPKTDSHIFQNYSFSKKAVKQSWIKAKLANKNDLLEKAGLPNVGSTKAGVTEKAVPLLGFIGRLVEQKGVDMITAMLPELFDTTDAQVIILGSGHMLYETDLQTLADKYPTRLHVHIGYSEDLAHQIEAGCYLFMMPSRF